MNFVDKVKVSAIAGNGGNGKLSFRHEKFVARGGPDGGDGGDGGNVILTASRNQNTLTAFRYKKELKADSGGAGGKRKQHGKNGLDLIVAVPVGTVVSGDNGKVLADLVEDNQSALIAKGGKGGFGNAHFVSSRRQAPNFAEKGEPGESLDLGLELKMIADVGLVGLPNAGKSTLLAKVSNAHPEIANYPFTTLSPNLGVVDLDKHKSMLVADIPGLIAGAAEGKGLGHDFLRHIERTAVILHLIDSYNESVVDSYQTVRNELEAYSKHLTKLPEIVALTKIDGLDKEIVNDLVSQLEAVVSKKTLIFPISAVSSQNLNELLFATFAKVQTYRNKLKAKTKAPTIPVLTLKDDDSKWQAKKTKDRYIISGKRIENFASRTDFSNPEAVQRLRDILRRQGILHELARKKIKPGEFIQIGDKTDDSFKY